MSIDRFITGYSEHKTKRVGTDVKVNDYFERNQTYHVKKYKNRKYYCRNFSEYINLPDIAEMLKNNDVKIVDGDEGLTFLWIIMLNEDGAEPLSVTHLNKIIRNGGFTAYIKNLEQEKLQ